MYYFLFNYASLLHKKYTFLCSTVNLLHKIAQSDTSAGRKKQSLVSETLYVLFQSVTICHGFIAFLD